MTTENEWIEWAGGSCPVDPTTDVVVQYAGETRSDAEMYGAAQAWLKVWNSVSAPIIAYRVESAQ